MSEDSREQDERPWGRYVVLDEGDGFKVKRIEVHPGRRLSYQRHARRSEHWMVVAGSGCVTLDGSDRALAVGDTVDVPIGVAHRMANPGDAPLVFIEIQRGDFLGESDIVRLADDFGRVE